MQIIHGLIFGKQGLVFRGASKKLYEHEHDNENFSHLAGVKQNLIILWQNFYA